MNKLPEKWHIKGCDELKKYFKEHDVRNLCGQYVDFSYFINKKCDMWDHCVGIRTDSTEITLDEFRSITEEFVLPNFWQIERNSENYFIINAWFNKYYSALSTIKEYTDKNGWVNNKNMNKLSRLNSLPIITFEQFKKYVLKETQEEMKKIVGYKLILPEYKQAALSICNTTANWENSLKPYDISISQTEYINRLKKAEVFDTWFESVFETEYKIGDWVKLVSKRPKNWNGFGLMDTFLGKIVQLTKIDHSSIYFINNGSWSFLLDDIERKATEEEINSVNILIKGYKSEILEGKVKFGCQTYTNNFIITLAKCLEENNLEMDYKPQIIQLAQSLK